jgi:hypothetical protein
MAVRLFFLTLRGKTAILKKEKTDNRFIEAPVYSPEFGSRGFLLFSWRWMNGGARSKP